jgi:hypothetical protein
MMYIGGWIAYLIAAMVVAIYWWRFTGTMRGGLWRGWLRWLLAAVLFTPAVSLQGSEQMAPAYIVLLFGMLTDGWEVAEPGGRALGVAIGLGFAVIAATSLVNRVKAGGKTE